MRRIKLVLFVLYIFGLLGLVVVHLLSSRGIGSSLQNILYWYIFLGWVWAVSIFALKSTVSLFLALVLFVIAVVVKIVGPQDLSQAMLRVSILGWLVGILQALIEYIKADEKVD